MNKPNAGLGRKHAAIGLLLVGLAACSSEQHPLDRQLSQLKPVALVPLEKSGWPAETLICPLTPYQNAVSGDSSTAKRVNAFLQKKRFQGDEAYWSLVTVKPGTEGDAGIEHIIFKRGLYDVVASAPRPHEASEQILAAFELKECVTAGEARILATAGGGAPSRTQIRFGTAK